MHRCTLQNRKRGERMEEEEEEEGGVQLKY